MARDYRRLSKGMGIVMGVVNRINQSYALYGDARVGGLTKTQAFLVILYKATNLLFKKLNVIDFQPTKILDDVIVGEEPAKILDDVIVGEEPEETLDDVIEPEQAAEPLKPVAEFAALPLVFDDKDHNNIIEATVLAAMGAPNQTLMIWVIPHCTNIWGGGHYTLFRFIDFFSKKYQVKNIIYLYDYIADFKTAESLQAELNHAFSSDHFYLTGNMDGLPPCDAVIATTWQSAYFAKKIPSKEKFYFMQDYESLFYPAGALALQANHTYGFGFHGVTGGSWLKNTYESYGGKAQAYVFAADRDIFYPADSKGLVRDQVRRIFFYGRPSTARRAYELGIVALEMIANQYPDIELVIAGLSGIAPPAFKCTLLGNLSLRETGDLYRTCDIGIALSATNMSYLPVELMASGCPVVSNEGPQVEWFCQDKHNALLTAPTPSGIFQAAKDLVDSKELRQSLVTNGLATTQATTWDQEMDKIYQYMNQKI